MKIIQYNLATRVNCGTEQEMVILSRVEMPWNEENEKIAKKEAHHGIYTVEDNGVGVTELPSQMDALEAQVMYTAMMTDTLLEE